MADTRINFDTRDMRALVTFMRRRFFTKSFVNVGAFTESEREEFDRLCAEMDVPSDATVKEWLRQSQEDETSAEDEPPVFRHRDGLSRLIAYTLAGHPVNGASLKREERA